MTLILRMLMVLASTQTEVRADSCTCSFETRVNDGMGSVAYQYDCPGHKDEWVNAQRVRRLHLESGDEYKFTIACKDLVRLRFFPNTEVGISGALGDLDP